MSWGDLLRALADEAEREAGAVGAGAERDAARAVEEARRVAAAARERALEEARARHASEARRALEVARRERERALLEASRAMLEEVRAEALARAIERAPTRTAALAETLAAEVGDREAEWIVDPGDEATVRDVLARRRSARPGAAEQGGAGEQPPFDVRAAPTRRGGPEVVVEGRVTLDATAAARLARAWEEAEPRLCALLFAAEGADGHL